MELRHLRHFVAVADELHFARAAERLGMEQSPLSQSIRNLEAELGVTLFQRTTRRTWLTGAGSRFYQDAKRILKDVEAATDAVRRKSETPLIAVRLVLGEDLADEPFTRMLLELQRRMPLADIEIREIAQAEAARLVRDGGVDVAFTRDPQPETDLQQTRAWSERLVVMTSIDHPFAKRASIGLRDLEGEPLTLPLADEGPGYLAQIGSLLDGHGIRASELWRVRYWNTAVSFAATGRAIVLCPKTLSGSAIGVAVVPLEDEDAELVTWLLYREGEPSTAVSLVLEAAGEVARDPLLSEEAGPNA